MRKCLRTWNRNPGVVFVEKRGKILLDCPFNYDPNMLSWKWFWSTSPVLLTMVKEGFFRVIDLSKVCFANVIDIYEEFLSVSLTLVKYFTTVKASLTNSLTPVRNSSWCEVTLAQQTLPMSLTRAKHHVIE
jgi:hypothetical protein